MAKTYLEAVDAAIVPSTLRQKNWRFWLYRGQVVHDTAIRPSFSTPLETLERQLAVSDGVAGHEQTVILPHFNAWAADVNAGDQVVLLCHTQADLDEPETCLTPNFFTLKGDWSFLLNLDTQTCWAAGRGVARNRYYAWSYELAENARFLPRPNVAIDPLAGITQDDSPWFKVLRVLSNLNRYVAGNHGARNVYSEGYVNVKSAYRLTMQALLKADAPQRQNPLRNFRGQVATELHSGDGLL